MDFSFQGTGGYAQSLCPAFCRELDAVAASRVDDDDGRSVHAALYLLFMCAAKNAARDTEQGRTRF